MVSGVNLPLNQSDDEGNPLRENLRPRISARTPLSLWFCFWTFFLTNEQKQEEEH